MATTGTNIATTTATTLIFQISMGPLDDATSWPSHHHCVDDGSG